MAEALLQEFLGQPDVKPQDIALQSLYLRVTNFCRELCEAEQFFAEDLAAGDRWDLMTDAVAVEFTVPNTPPSLRCVEEYLAPIPPDTMMEARQWYVILTTLNEELNKLVTKAWDVYIPALALFGEPCEDSNEEDGPSSAPPNPSGSHVGDEALYFSRIMPMFLELWNYRKRCCLVVQNLIRQISLMHTQHTLFDFENVSYVQSWSTVGRIVAALLAMEEIIRQNESFSKHFTIFKRMLRTAQTRPEKYNTDVEKCAQVENLLSTVLNEILSGSFADFFFQFEYFTQQERGPLKSSFEDLMKIVQNVLRSRTPYLNTALESNSRLEIVGAVGLFALQISSSKYDLRPNATRFGSDAYKNVIREIFLLQRLMPIAHIYGAYYWDVGKLLRRLYPNAVPLSVKEEKETSAAMGIHHKNLTSKLEGTLQSFTSRVNVWTASFEAYYLPQGLGSADITRVAMQGVSLTLKGITLMSDLNNYIKNAFGLLINSQVGNGAVTPQRLLHFSRLSQMIIAIRCTMHSKTSVLSVVYPIALEIFRTRLQQKLHRAYLAPEVMLKAKFVNSSIKLFPRVCTRVMMYLLTLPLTSTTLWLFQLTLDVCNSRQDWPVNPEQRQEIIEDFRSLENWVRLGSMLRKAGDLSYLFWYHDLLWPLQLKNIMQCPAFASELPVLSLYIDDALPMLKKAQHGATRWSLLRAYHKSVMNHFNTEIVRALCRAIEDFLRVHIHSLVMGQPYDIIKSPPQNFIPLLRLEHLRLLGRVICLKHEVCKYLQAQFYNLTALQPRHWKTYEEMRAFAKQIFDITLIDSHLPGHVMDQGLDVLVITRRIGDFVARYTYNMNNQLFIERPNMTESKHLHTLQIHHVANSIRTHGTGIMNTTVNFVYQYLTKKLSLFSQFLFDDHVKSRLIKDVRYFQETKATTNNSFPVSRARKFCTDIKKLGMLDDGKSYLDQFRQLITEIGNALGYVRMMRSGGLRTISEAAVFIPHLDQLTSTQDILERKKNPRMLWEPNQVKKTRPRGGGSDAGADDNSQESDQDLGGFASDLEGEEEEEEVPVAASETSIRSAHTLDSVLKNTARRLSNDSDFFHMIFATFEERLNNEKNAHLRNFYIIVPALTLSFVEHISANKERLLIKGKEAIFTDDGFSLGIAFLLTLLHSVRDFDSLHWFSSVQKHFFDEKLELEKVLQAQSRKKKGSAIDTAVTTAPLTLNKVMTHLDEFSLLESNLRCARVLFKEKGVSVMADDEMEDMEEDTEP